MAKFGLLARGLAIVSVIAVAGCFTPRDLAPPGAMLSSTPGAPGYMIIGLVEKNYRCEFGAATQFIMLRLIGGNGKNLVAPRSNCQIGIDNGQIVRRVLQVPAGHYRPESVTEKLAVFVTDRLLSDDINNAKAIEVRSGTIVYAGDYVFASDFEAQEIKLIRVDHDAAGAAEALRPYPNLSGAAIVDGGGLRDKR